KLGLTLLEVERAVRKAWSDAYIAKQKYVLYQKLDSVFTEFKRAARLRYEQEAISKLAFLAAKNQVQQIILQKVQYNNNYQSALIKLKACLVSESLFAPVMTNPSMLVESAEDRPYNLQSHPVLGMARDKVEVADALYGVAKS